MICIGAFCLCRNWLWSHAAQLLPRQATVMLCDCPSDATHHRCHRDLGCSEAIDPMVTFSQVGCDPALENRDRKEKHRRNLQLDLKHCWNWRKSRFHRKFLIGSSNHQATILLRSCQVPWCTISPAKPMQFNAAGSASKKGGLSGDGRGWLVYCLFFFAYFTTTGGFYWDFTGYSITFT